MQSTGSSLAIIYWNPVVVHQDYKTLLSCYVVNSPHGENLNNCKCTGTNGVKDRQTDCSFHISELHHILHYNQETHTRFPN